MPGVALARKRWSPGPNATVDRSHPLASGLRAAWMPGRSIRCVASGAPIQTFSGSALTTVATAAGLGGSLPAGSINGVGFDPMGAGSRGAAMICWVGAASANAINAGNDDPSSQRWSIHYSYAGTFYFDAGNFAGGDRISAAYSTSLVGRVNVLVASNGPAGGHSLYVNGSRLANKAESTSKSSTLNRFAVGWGGGVANDVASTQVFVCAWNRELSPGEASQVFADPFCMLRGG